MLPGGCSVRNRTEVREQLREALSTSYISPLAAGSARPWHRHHLNSKTRSRTGPRAGKVNRDLWSKAHCWKTAALTPEQTKTEKTDNMNARAVSPNTADPGKRYEVLWIQNEKPVSTAAAVSRSLLKTLYGAV